jgi:DNA-binding transcriptional regulator YiaG
LFSKEIAESSSKIHRVCRGIQIGLSRKAKMSDIDKYIAKRERKPPGFRDGVEREAGKIRIGLKIKKAREAAGLTQEEFARCMHTSKSAVSRMENHAESVQLATLERVAAVFGKKLVVDFK